jgi:hypothetical protein
MTNKNMSKCSKGLILLLILMLAFVSTPSLTTGQITGKPSQNEAKISEELAANFLKEVGFENATAIQFSTTTDSGIERGEGAYSLKEEGKSITISVVSPNKPQAHAPKTRRKPLRRGCPLSPKTPSLPSTLPAPRPLLDSRTRPCL